MRIKGSSRDIKNIVIMIFSRPAKRKEPVSDLHATTYDMKWSTEVNKKQRGKH